ncbi:Isochorismatase hydrolase [Parathielavia appendiculata]|uniref:Isochorismatase hydrolase n=1 Tax=Parathielavia appendiculata TaxID=2587402 RepID=A0AAN6TSI1_9PEZI|nr:Isochorismatase hydrolase [Parathielavia appendiculata]
MAAALFVIDIQNDLAIDPETCVPHAERVTAAGEFILKTARAYMETETGSTKPPLASIVFVQHEEKPEDGPLVRGSEPWKLVFEPRAGESRERLIHKTTRDTFASNPDLAAELKAAGINHIIAFGIQSECCVESTCNGAIDAGFGVTLLSGAHSTYDDGDKTAEDIEREVEDRLEKRGADVIDWTEAAFMWDKGHGIRPPAQQKR